LDVSGASALRSLHEPFLDAWSLRDTNLLECFQPVGGCVARRGDTRQLRLGLDDFLLLDLVIDLELAEITENSAGLRCETIGFCLQRLNARRGAIGLRFRIALPVDGDCPKEDATQTQ
jgi:hypothetical protein